MKRRQRNNSIKRIIVLLFILALVILYKEPIGQEFEGFMTNYYSAKSGISTQISPY